MENRQCRMDSGQWTIESGNGFQNVSNIEGMSYFYPRVSTRGDRNNGPEDFGVCFCCVADKKHDKI